MKDNESTNEEEQEVKFEWESEEDRISFESSFWN